MNASTQAEALVHDIYNEFPLAFVYSVICFTSLSILCSLFVVVCFLNHRLSVVEAPLLSVLSVALFDLIFAGTLLTNLVLTSPAILQQFGLLRLTSGEDIVSNDLPIFNTTETDAVTYDAFTATMSFCRTQPWLGSLLAASYVGAEVVFVTFAFEIRSFSEGPFGRGIKICRCGLYYVFQPVLWTVSAAVTFVVYYISASLAPTEVVGSYPFGGCFVSFPTQQIGVSLNSLSSRLATVIFLVIYSTFFIISIAAGSSIVPFMRALSQGSATESKLLEHARLYAQIMEPRKRFIHGFGYAIVVQIAYRALCTICLVLISLWTDADASFTLWGQHIPSENAPNLGHAILIYCSIALWSLRGVSLFLALWQASFLRYVCCECKICIPNPIERAQRRDEALAALIPSPPHKNQILDNTIGSILGEGIAFLSIQPPSISMVGMHCLKEDFLMSLSGKKSLVGHVVVIDRGDFRSIGTVRYHGKTSFAIGIWVGAELVDASGRNDGEVQGKRYFDCPKNHGLFVPYQSILEIRQKKENADTRQNDSNQENRSCCEAVPMEPFFVHPTTQKPIGDEIQEGKYATSILYSLHEDVLRPLRKFFLGELYCPEYGLNGDPADAGLKIYLNESRHLKTMSLFFNQTRFCKKMSRWYYAFRERHWKFCPHPITNVFRYSSLDNRILIDCISHEEYEALKILLTSPEHASEGSTQNHYSSGPKKAYMSYVKRNPETFLPRIVGCYLLHHKPLRMKEYFIAYLNPHPPPNAIRAAYNLNGCAIGRWALPILHASPVICRHCGDAYFHGMERLNSKLSQKRNHSEAPHRTTNNVYDKSHQDSDYDRWLSRCIHRPLKVELDNDFNISILAADDDALSQSAQLVADVGFLQAFGHTNYSMTLSLAKSASISYEQYLEGESRRLKVRRGILSPEEAAEEEAIQFGYNVSRDGDGSSANVSFEAIVNGAKTPIHIGLENVLTRWTDNTKRYAWSLHKREKIAALCGCFKHVVQAKRLKSRPFDGRKLTRWQQYQMRHHLKTGDLPPEQELLTELRDGLEPVAHATRFINRIVYRLFKELRTRAPKGKGTAFNADQHLARANSIMHSDIDPCGINYIQENGNKIEKEKDKRQPKTPREVELRTYSSDCSSHRLVLPTPVRRTSTGNYQYGYAVEV